MGGRPDVFVCVSKFTSTYILDMYTRARTHTHDDRRSANMKREERAAPRQIIERGLDTPTEAFHLNLKALTLCFPFLAFFERTQQLTEILKS